MLINIYWFHKRAHCLVHICHELFRVNSSYFPLLVLWNTLKLTWIIIFIIVFWTISNIMSRDPTPITNVPFLWHLILILIVHDLTSSSRPNIITTTSTSLTKWIDTTSSYWVLSSTSHCIYYDAISSLTCWRSRSEGLEWGMRIPIDWEKAYLITFSSFTFFFNNGFASHNLCWLKFESP